MGVEIKVDPQIMTPKVVIHTRDITQEITDLAEKLSGAASSLIAGYRDQEVLLVEPQDVYRIYAQQAKVMARLEKSEVQLKCRLYEIEKKLALSSFIRISGSEIVNVDKVKSLDLSMSGSLGLTMHNGDKTFVSRRYVEKMKKYLDL